MTRARSGDGRHQLVRATSRRLVLAGLALTHLWLCVEVFGPIPVALIVAAVGTLAGVVWWARVVEPRLFTDSRPPRSPGAQPLTANERHLAFARALAAVAARYLDECERENRL
jgi:hypothetical protein